VKSVREKKTHEVEVDRMPRNSVSTPLLNLCEDEVKTEREMKAQQKKQKERQ